MSTGESVTSPQADVLIVGAGPSGLVLALELARAKVSFRLVERSKSPAIGSRAKGVQPRTLEIFNQLGIIDEVLAHGQMGMPIWSTDMDGHESQSEDAAPSSLPDTPYPASVTIPLFRVEAALRRRLEEFGGRVDFGAELISFKQSAAGVTATVMERGRSRAISARWLVGCDGGHSVVRKGANIQFEGMTFESARMIIADVRLKGLDRTYWRLWRHMDGFVGLCPLPSTDLFQFQASTRGAQDSTLSLANMQAILDRRAGASGVRLTYLDWGSLWRANIRLASQYRSGRVFIVGDAAHVHAPSGGQGMNTGIQDAHNLAWKLAAVLAGAPETLIDSYEAERRPIAASVIKLSRELSRESLATRGITIPRDARTWELDLDYRGSPIVRDDRDDGAPLRGGDRAPDAAGLITQAGQRRLFDLLRHGDFTLIVFGDAPVEAMLVGRPAWLRVRIVRVVDELAHPDDVIDATANLRLSYGARDGTVVLIRPDGYVASILDTMPDDFWETLA